MSIEQGQYWKTSSWRQAPRRVVVVAVQGDEVEFRFIDTGRTSRCSDTAFRRTFEECVT